MIAQQPSGMRDDRPTVERWLERAGVPLRFRDSRLSSFKPRTGVQRGREAAGRLLERLAANPGEDRGLVLAGDKGTGKTHLAVSILASRYEAWLAEYPDPFRESLGGGVAVRPNLAQRFVVVPTLLDRLRTGIEYRDATDPLPGLIEADLLVLDDLGREKSTDWVLERLYVLVNERYNDRRPTITTSNFTPDELVARGYDAIISRLLAGAELVKMTGPDYRAGAGS